MGIERTVVPLIGAEEFHLSSTTLIVSFIISFGAIKALANLVSGQLADTWGRKHVLVLGWLFGLGIDCLQDAVRQTRRQHAKDHLELRARDQERRPEYREARCGRFIIIVGRTDWRDGAKKAKRY